MWTTENGMKIERENKKTWTFFLSTFPFMPFSSQRRLWMLSIELRIGEQKKSLEASELFDWHRCQVLRKTFFFCVSPPCVSACWAICLKFLVMFQSVQFIPLWNNIGEVFQSPLTISIPFFFALFSFNFCPVTIASEQKNEKFGYCSYLPNR